MATTPNPPKYDLLFANLFDLFTSSLDHRHIPLIVYYKVPLPGEGAIVQKLHQKRPRPKTVFDDSGKVTTDDLGCSPSAPGHILWSSKHTS